MAPFFHENIPPLIKDEIEQVEQALWNHVQSMDMDNIKAKVEEWVSDPGTTIGHLYSYENMLTTH